MPHVVFVAPHFLENTNRYLSAFAALDGVTLSVVSEDAEAAIPPVLRARIAGHYKVEQCLDRDALTKAVRWIHGDVGRVDRLAGALEQLQMPMAYARDALDIEGVRSDVARNFRDKDRMHLRDLAGVGLVDASWLPRFPAALAERLKMILADPEG